MATATHVGPILVSGLGIQGPATTQTALPSTLLLVNNAGTGYITGCGPSPGVNGEIIFQTDTSNGSNPQRVLALEGDGDGIFYNNLTVQGILTALTKLDVDGDAQFNANVGVTGALEAQRGDYTSLFVQGSRVLTEAELPPDAIPYPPPGVSVSTGTAWSPSINPADLPRLSTPNTFTAAQTINGAITVAGGANLNGGVASGIYYLNSITPSATWNSDGGTTFIDCGGTGRLLLNYNHNPGGVGFGNNGAGGPVVMFDPAGNAVFNGGVNSPGYTATGNPPVVNGSGRLSWNADNTILDGFGSGGSRGTIHLRVSSANAANLLDALIIDANGNATFAGNVTMGSFFQITGPAGTSTTTIFGAGNTTYMDSHGSSPSASSAFLFRTMRGDDSNTVNVLSIDSVGNANFAGTITAAGKSFLIAHPLIEGKDLIHGSLEGPEHGVYYRGEVTTKKGTAEVTLPDYFESLTFKEDRSVMLTQKLHPGDSVLSMLAATPISKGKFIIVSSVPATIVAWEVKAVRRIGVDRLAVVRDRFVHPTKEDA